MDELSAFAKLGLDLYEMNFFAAVIAAVYSEGMARQRRYPAISYLVISNVPLMPARAYITR